MMLVKHVCVVDSPIGPLTLVAEGEELRELRFGGLGPSEEGCDSGTGASSDAATAAVPILERAADEVREFFAGERHDFSIPLAWEGTEFQKRVWSELCKIPYGTTCSYADLARRIGSPKSARAVGMAVGRNPLAIVVPCHRVIGTNGSLVGFGGGLDIKRRLLELESHAANA